MKIFDFILNRKNVPQQSEAKQELPKLTYNDFDTVYHLVGEQTIPIFLAAIQFPRTTKHYLLSTRTHKTQIAMENLKKTLRKNGYIAEAKYLGDEDDAVDMSKLPAAIQNVLDKTLNVQKPILFNLTGGNKIMALCAMQYALKNNSIHAFYLDTNGRKFIDVRSIEHYLPLNQKLTIENFINLGGNECIGAENKTYSEKMLEYMWSKRSLFQRLQESFANLIKKNDKNIFTQKEAELEKLLDETWFQYQKSELKSLNWTKKASLFAGGWLEHYVFIKLKKCNNITEIKTNVRIKFPDAKIDAQEFDVVYTDGYSLFIIECKAGKIAQEHVQKLENLRERFAGVLSRAALVAINPAEKYNNLIDRVQASRSISFFGGAKGIDMLQQNNLNFSSGKIYE